MKDQLNLRVLTTNRSIWQGKMAKWQLFKYHPKQKVCMDWVDRYGILRLLQGSHLDNFLLKTLKLGWVAFHSLTFQLKCLDFQSNQYKKLVLVLSRFCNGLLIQKNSKISLKIFQNSTYLVAAQKFIQRVVNGLKPVKLSVQGRGV